MASLRNHKPRESDEFRDVIIRVPKEVWLRLIQLSEERTEAETEDVPEREYDIDLVIRFDALAEQAEQMQQFWDDYFAQIKNMNASIDEAIRESNAQIESIFQGAKEAMESLRREQEYMTALVDLMKSATRFEVVVPVLPPLFDDEAEDDTPEEQPDLEDPRESLRVSLMQMQRGEGRPAREVLRVLFTPKFESNLEHLQRRYRRIDLDIEPTIDELERGELPGDKIPGIGHDVYKVRAANRDANKGKSGGYRIIYYVRLADLVYLLTIYSKSDQKDVSAKDVRLIVEEVLKTSPNEQE
jgi:mRNA-degrading endonuclease RelE of RelBE toxin-antitoxin system